ncbi:LacI family DNA-binding transcriptional regulator [Olsenella sp. YH-ols2217]|uniref:LacI family DNA-binding transcriptional regulator n=1 Tax=Kribbibacterium absianum TaxID=3044210 RepID=A0ABT6ZMB6_9ACTN|nr:MULTISPECIES: LacI family DNA-binding transcriptional regulator [unclassified Olsenella]MDJ1121768.1 LacI family DNA-binding transcriptional regulator [Olsenella sp. YH-ols2216]MDJ1129776.1 LacI family DNA-binding transcriptional regulator [Olsenella sp. YH-ols2217]
MARSSVSIYDIARIAGVSTATVSNVLNGKGRFSQATKELVESVAAEQGYVASYAAKVLREDRSRTVGILTPDVSNEFFSAMVLGAEATLNDAGYSSFICNTGNRQDRAAASVRSLMEKSVDGLVFIGGSRGAEPAVVGDLPCVLSDYETQTLPARCAVVGNDLRGMTRSQAAVLARRGCEHIAYVGVGTGGRRWKTSPRYLGYLDALDVLGLEPMAALESPIEGASRDEAKAAVVEAFARNSSVDGLVAPGDRIALGCLDALLELGVEPGGDVRLIGCDDSVYSRIVTPAISSVDRHVPEIAAQCGRAMLAMLAGEEPVGQVLVPYDVVERETTLGPSA